jgi:hypothetical protein
MKKSDLAVIVGVILFLLPFFIFDKVFDFYEDFNKEHSMITSFVKFAILATFGETIGQRIRTGKYLNKGFGLFPRVIVWGVIGLTIKMAFIIFATGTPNFLEYLGIKGAAQSLNNVFSLKKLIVAFFISATMNVIYAPIMMTFHKITDKHIESYGGKIICLIKPINIRKIIINLDWDIQWNFVFKKTIPFFWIPAHTITFLLNEEYQVLFAAFLGVCLGVILSVASLKKNSF